MTVLSAARAKRRAKRFFAKGRYSYTSLLLQFGCDWGVDFPDILARIDRLKSGRDFAFLIRDILLADPNRTGWPNHTRARGEIGQLMANAIHAYDTVLKPSADRKLLTVEYLADGLDTLKSALAR